MFYVYERGDNKVWKPIFIWRLAQYMLRGYFLRVSTNEK